MSVQTRLAARLRSTRPKAKTGRGDVLLHRERSTVDDHELPDQPPRAQSAGWGDMSWLRRYR